MKRVLHDTATRINTYFPYARIFPYSSLYTSSQQLNGLTEFIHFNFNHKNIDAERTEKLLFFIRKTIIYLLDVNVNINMYIFACLNMYKFNHFFTEMIFNSI